MTRLARHTVGSVRLGTGSAGAACVTGASSHARLCDAFGRPDRWRRFWPPGPLFDGGRPKPAAQPVGVVDGWRPGEVVVGELVIGGSRVIDVLGRPGVGGELGVDGGVVGVLGGGDSSCPEKICWVVAMGAAGLSDR